MRRQLLLLALLCALCGAERAAAQYYTWGSDPPQKWSAIRTPDVRMIYPDTVSAVARRTLFYIRTVRPDIAFGFRHGPMRIPFVMHPENFQSNGLVMYLPKRVEFLTSPAVEGYSMPWYKQLVAHEYRHAVQYNNLDRGVIRALSYILGQQGSTIGLLCMPIWAMEGENMIEYIHGDLTELTPAMAVVETAGVGYGLNISLNTYTAIQGKQEVKLYVHEVLVAGGRDDSFTLFGFATKQERELYRLLITVSGVGGNTARMILSSMSPAELCSVISTGNDKMLKTVKGIGLKTAQRIILDLKDKIVSLGIADELPANGGNVAMVNSDIKDEAVSALTMLGFSPAPSAKVVVDILKAQPDLPVEQVVKLALKQIK